MRTQSQSRPDDLLADQDGSVLIEACIPFD
jgi:hypothetical protein